jgi:hypothetical protein
VIDDETLRTLIYLMVIILAPVNMYTTFTLLRLSHRYDGKIGALSERATVAGFLMIGSIAGATLAFTRLVGPEIPTTLSIALNGVAAAMLAAPALYWMWKYRSGGFGENNDG